MLRASDLRIVLDDDHSEDPYFLARIETQFGRLDVLGEFELSDRSMIVRGLHVGGDPGVIWGWSRLRMIGRAVAEALDVDWIEIEGAVRTSGGNPGRRPRRVRLARTT